ncbi:MAG: hypothetical protein AB1791_13455 [Chloroflexota bacterium]
MSTTIILPDELASALQMKAERRHSRLNEFVVEILSDTINWQKESYPTIEEVVAETKALPPNPAMISWASDSLAEWLRNTPDDEPFDPAEWQREWDQVETEMKAIEAADMLADASFS